jgi:omega-amidase
MELRITTVQTSLAWEDSVAALNHFSKLLKQLKKNSTDLVILPEMFNTGFTMNAASLAQEMNGDAMTWMANSAAKLNAVFCGSIIIKEKGSYYNRLIWMNPDGTYKFYDKRHLFRMALENDVYTGGKKKIIVELKGWNICPLICYDLRFPVWSRNRGEYDLLIYIANWPTKRKYAWQQLLIARAIENQCFVAAVNRIGVDGNNISYPGLSMILDPLGKKVSVSVNVEELKTTVINKSELERIRMIFPVMLDADNFKIL